MTDRLSLHASDDYLELTFVSRSIGIIGQTYFLERMLALSKLGDPEAPAIHYALRVLRQYEWPDDGDEWNQRGEASIQDGGDKLSFEPKIQRDDEGRIFFRTNAGGLKSWFFRPGDPDYFPSVPHGHWEDRSQPKLDAYLGWVYVGSKQTDRIARKSIVALWNDEDFRYVAAKAINYYLTYHPHYKGWRVAHPRRLPRRTF